MEIGPLSIKKWDAGGKNGEIDQFLAELVSWLSCKISFFTISNHTNGAAEILQWQKNSLNTKIEIRRLKTIRFDVEMNKRSKMLLSFYESTRIFKIQVSLDLSHSGQRVSV